MQKTEERTLPLSSKQEKTQKEEYQAEVDKQSAPLAQMSPTLLTVE
jgi:hypothetical protein